jgi:hypothetical protein
MVSAGFIRRHDDVQAASHQTRQCLLLVCSVVYATSRRFVSRAHQASTYTSNCMHIRASRLPQMCANLAYLHALCSKCIARGILNTYINISLTIVWYCCACITLTKWLTTRVSLKTTFYKYREQAKYIHIKSSLNSRIIVYELNKNNTGPIWAEINITRF